jgi:hypothetical protein
VSEKRERNPFKIGCLRAEMIGWLVWFGGGFGLGFFGLDLGLLLMIFSVFFDL